MTSGEKHLRKEVGFVNAIDTKLNLGSFDWTVEFWLASRKTAEDGVVFELGTGLYDADKKVTRLELSADGKNFRLQNDASDGTVA